MFRFLVVALSPFASAVRGTMMDADIQTEDLYTAHAFQMVRRYTKLQMTEEEVQRVLDQHGDLKEAVGAHLNFTETRLPASLVQGDLKSALLERARAALGDKGKALDGTVHGKTPCRCFIEKIKILGQKVQLADLDRERVGYSCASSCMNRCSGDSKYKMDPHEARVLGADGVHQAMKVGQCEDGECKCLDATQSVQQVRWANERLRTRLDVVVLPAPHYAANEPPNQYNSPEECLNSCGRYSCRDQQMGAYEIDWEGMCIDEWGHAGGAGEWGRASEWGY
ncbi:unnamed protein product [Effrenium voratum]|nr:unnamed protein product [Effrenium voratum]|mmetsp:Transcript_22389/g.53307  ORF Transcript_22389/g.53307 Transcript_22389/m.53307 type:complete len:281 (-) Transcript_22389:51-893(-)